MARLTAISGIGGKLPAAFLLEINGKRLLLDLGEGPEAGVFPDVGGIGSVDAICLSHAHMDHAGALQLSEKLGNPPIYATATTFRNLALGAVKEAQRRFLPARGATEIEGIKATLGRCGHAPGGVWFHFQSDGGILYTGDWSIESLLLPFDPPPAAYVLVTDASYGDRDASLADQIGAIAEMAASGAVLPVPRGGRGPEMALALAARNLHPKVCPQVRSEMEALAQDPGAIGPDMRQILRDFLTQEKSDDSLHPSDIIIAVEANGEAGASAELVSRIDEGFRFIFSSHVARGTPAERLIATGKANWLPWNVHPRLQDVLNLCEAVGATKVMPAFVKPDAMPLLAEKLDRRLVVGKTITVSPDTVAEMESSR